MKEQKLVELVNKVNNLESYIKQIITELYNLKDLSVGTLEAVKIMPGYVDAIKKLTEKLKKANESNDKKLELDVE